MGGVLSLVQELSSKLTPKICNKILRLASGGAKVQQFSSNGTPYRKFILFLMDEIHSGLTKHLL
jgi:hypothetical protein